LNPTPYNNMKKTEPVKSPCKKPCQKQESSEIRIVWDHEISEKIYELEAKILTYTIIGASTLFVSICNLVALIIKK
jgi:O-succinylbenzoate synthase